jgi:hypothetical protein
MVTTCLCFVPPRTKFVDLPLEAGQAIDGKLNPLQEPKHLRPPRHISCAWHFRFVLIASSFGRHLAEEVVREGAQFLLAPDGKSVIKPLLKVASQHVLDLWFDQLEQCSRLRPVNEKVLIVVNDDHAPAIERWAASRQFPTCNIIRNGTLTMKTVASRCDSIDHRPASATLVSC